VAGTPTAPMPEAPPAPAPTTVSSGPGRAPTTGAPEPPAWRAVPHVAGGVPEPEAVEGRTPEPEPGTTQAEAEGGAERAPEPGEPGEPPEERPADSL